MRSVSVSLHEVKLRYILWKQNAEVHVLYDSIFHVRKKYMKIFKHPLICAKKYKKDKPESEEIDYLKM